jgi:hypothetical protein
LRRVHPHVQRRLGAEAESALRRVQLVAGEPEVEEHAVHLAEPRLAGEGVDVGKVRLQEDRARVEPRQRLGNPDDGLGIAVDPEQPAAGLDALEQGAGVPSASQGRVDEDRPRTGLKELY